jgi:hypothetical protein
MHRMLVLAALGSGCGAYLTGGIDTSSKVSGGLAQPMKATRIADGSAPAATALGKTYTLGVGWGSDAFGIGFALQGHDVDRQTFAFSDTSAPRYATATASLDVQWAPVRWKMLSTFVHAGPSFAALIDRTTGGYDTGKGVRFGGGFAVSLSVVTAFVDFYQMQLEFSSGAAQGLSQITGATVGIGINR